MAAAGSGDGSGGEKTIVLFSSDNARFEVREAAALLSQTVRRMIDDVAAGSGNTSGGGDGDGSIRIPDVDARTLAKVLEYCNKHAPASSCSSAEAAATSSEDLENFDREFMRVDMDTLNFLITAADSLKVEGLLDLAGQTVAGMIKGKTQEQIKQTLGIKSDLAPGVKDQMRRGPSPWADFR